MKTCLQAVYTHNQSSRTACACMSQVSQMWVLSRHDACLPKALTSSRPFVHTTPGSATQRGAQLPMLSEPRTWFDCPPSPHMPTLHSPGRRVTIQQLSYVQACRQMACIPLDIVEWHYSSNPSYDATHVHASCFCLVCMLKVHWGEVPSSGHFAGRADMHHDQLIATLRPI